MAGGPHGDHFYGPKNLSHIPPNFAPLFCTGPFCTVYGLPKKQKRNTDGFQKKKRRKFRIIYRTLLLYFIDIEKQVLIKLVAPNNLDENSAWIFPQLLRGVAVASQVAIVNRLKLFWRFI